MGLGRSKSVRCSRVKFGLVSLDDDDDGDGEGGDGSVKGKKEEPAMVLLPECYCRHLGGDRQDQKEEEATRWRRTNCEVPFVQPWRRGRIIRDLSGGRGRADGRGEGRAQFGSSVVVVLAISPVLAAASLLVFTCGEAKQVNGRLTDHFVFKRRKVWQNPFSSSIS